MAPSALPQDLDLRNNLQINLETIDNTTDTNFPSHYLGEDHAWNVDEFQKALRIQFHYNTPYDISFSLIQVSAPIANAFRRILLSNIPTLAIERVYVYNNTSIIQDEVLASRLGLLPLEGPSSLLSRIHWPLPKNEAGEPTCRDIDTLVFKLQLRCSVNAEASKGETDPAKLYHHGHVYARDLVWVPQGRQAQWLGIQGIDPEDIPEQLRMKCANPDILVAKLRPNHELELEMHAVKGSGQDHAKFSPVATATYRLLPTIDILKPILGDDAIKFQGCFPPGVIELETVTATEAAQAGSGFEGKKGEKKAIVKDAFSDTVSRECLRHDEFRGKVRLGRKKDHFIFSVESTGQFESYNLFLKSVKTLKVKCLELKNDLTGIVQ